MCWYRSWPYNLHPLFTQTHCYISEVSHLKLQKQRTYLAPKQLKLYRHFSPMKCCIQTTKNKWRLSHAAALGIIRDDVPRYHGGRSVLSLCPTGVVFELSLQPVRVCQGWRCCWPGLAEWQGCSGDWIDLMPACRDGGTVRGDLWTRGIWGRV